MHSRMKRRNSNAENMALIRALNGNSSTLNGPLVVSDSSAFEGICITVDLNIPCVPNDGQTEVDERDTNYHQKRLCGRKGKAPVDIVDENIPYVPTESHTEVDPAAGLDDNDMIRRKGKAPVDENIPYVPNDGHTEVDLAFGLSDRDIKNHQQLHHWRDRKAPDTTSAGTTRTVSDFVSSSRNTSPVTLGSLPQFQLGIDIYGTSSGTIYSSSVGASSSISHIPIANNNAGSSRKVQRHAPIASFYEDTQFPAPSRIFPLGNTSSSTYPHVLHPNFHSNILSDAHSNANGVIGDTRTADFPPVIGETIAADNGERLESEDHNVVEPGHRDRPIVIPDDEEGDQRGLFNMYSVQGLFAILQRQREANGLKKKVISALLRHRKYQPAEANDCNNSCGICLDEYSDGDELGKLNCGHEFHYHCIRRWLKTNNSCPYCKRTALTPP